MKIDVTSIESILQSGVDLLVVDRRAASPAIAATIREKFGQRGIDVVVLLTTEPVLMFRVDK